MDEFKDVVYKPVNYAYIVYENPNDIKCVESLHINDNWEIVKLDYSYYKDKRIASRLKGSVASRLNPVVIIKENDKITKVFYREEFDKPIDKFVEWINNKFCND